MEMGLVTDGPREEIAHKLAERKALEQRERKEREQKLKEDRERCRLEEMYLIVEQFSGLKQADVEALSPEGRQELARSMHESLRQKKNANVYLLTVCALVWAGWFAVGLFTGLSDWVLALPLSAQLPLTIVSVVSAGTALFGLAEMPARLYVVNGELSHTSLFKSLNAKKEGEPNE